MEGWSGAALCISQVSLLSDGQFIQNVQVVQAFLQQQSFKERLVLPNRGQPFLDQSFKNCICSICRLCPALSRIVKDTLEKFSINCQ